MTKKGYPVKHYTLNDGFEYMNIVFSISQISTKFQSGHCKTHFSISSSKFLQLNLLANTLTIVVSNNLMY